MNIMNHIWTSESQTYCKLGSSTLNLQRTGINNKCHCYLVCGQVNVIIIIGPHTSTSAHRLLAGNNTLSSSSYYRLPAVGCWSGEPNGVPRYACLSVSTQELVYPTVNGSSVYGYGRPTATSACRLAFFIDYISHDHISEAILQKNLEHGSIHSTLSVVNRWPSPVNVHAIRHHR